MKKDLYVAYIEGNLPDDAAYVSESLDEVKSEAKSWFKEASEIVVIIGRITPYLKLSLPPAEIWEEEL